MSPRKTPPHRDIVRPVDRRFSLTQLGRLSVWLTFDGDERPFAEIHLNERGSRARSPRLIEACALLSMAGESYDFVETIARTADNINPAELVAVIRAKARELVEKKEQFQL